jgi:hypothetical protein
MTQSTSCALISAPITVRFNQEIDGAVLIECACHSRCHTGTVQTKWLGLPQSRALVRTAVAAVAGIWDCCWNLEYNPGVTIITRAPEHAHSTTSLGIQD